MAKSTSKATWNGDLQQGSGSFEVGSACRGSFTAGSRFENEDGSNPEELIAAALAGCYSMALSHNLKEAGHKPQQIDTVADIYIEQKDGGFEITNIDLNVIAKVPGVDKETFEKQAKATKEGCPVSKALAGTTINLSAELVN